MRSGMSKGRTENNTEFSKPKIPHKNKQTNNKQKLLTFKINRKGEFCENMFSHLHCPPSGPLPWQCYHAVLKQMKLALKHFWRKYSVEVIGKLYWKEICFQRLECRIKILAVNISVSCLYQFTFFQAAVRKHIGVTWERGGSNLNLCQWPVLVHILVSL